MPAGPSLDERVLIRAPVGADATNTREVLDRAGFLTEICRDLNEVTTCLLAGCGAVLLTEEAVTHNEVAKLRAALDRQPKWSDMPVILITGGGHTTLASTTAVDLLGPNCSLTLVERPLRTVTLIAALKAALRSRRRQYEVRQLIAEREELLASLEKRVEERTARLQQIVEELESFSYSVSHDLRAPLRALDAYAVALREDCAGSLDPRAADYAEKISRAAQRMDHLTQDLLIYTRISRQPVELERVEPASVLHDVIQNYPSITPWSENISVQEPLPAVCGHAPSLTQCFSNLLENAFKFVRPGETPHVNVRGTCEHGLVKLSVQDNGIGIDPVHQERIFGIFERVAPHAEGTGIGLAIVRRAVERMGGRVGVESAKGKGATFWLELPAANPLPDRIQPDGHAGKAPDGQRARPTAN